MLSGARALHTPQELDCYGRPIPRPRELYYSNPHKLGIEISSKLGPWEVQWDRGVPLRQLSGKEAKAKPSPNSRVRARQVTQRMEQELDIQVIDLESYAKHFALGPEAQAEVARRLREDGEQNAAKQAAAEAKGGADEMERVE